MKSRHLFWGVVFLLWLLVPRHAFAQLPMGIPDFCAGSPDNVPAGTVANVSGVKGCLGIHGDVTIVGALKVDQILVYADGSLTVPPGAAITFRDFPLDPVTDPEQWGHGLIAFGKVRMTGTPKTPFCRAGELLAGATSLCAASDWLPTDQKFIADSRQVPDDDAFNAAYASHAERIIVSPLQFDHPCARLPDGSATNLCPHVANLTRSILIRSEHPTGVRGHMAFIGRADVQIVGVEVRDMGRTKAIPLDSFPGQATNQIGRYAVHFHMLWGPVNPTNTGYQFQFTDSVIVDALKWPLAFHGSHFGRIARNVIIGGADLTGAGIAGEDGSETDNLVDGNFVAEIRGQINPRDTGGPTTANGACPGCGGECIWAAGFNTRYTNNVVTGCRNPVQNIVNGVGFKFYQPAASFPVKTPKVRGADLTDPAQTREVIPQTQPLLEFRGNEAYGGMADCVTIWHLGTDSATDTATGDSIITNLTCWHTFEGAVWLYPTSRLTVDGLRYVTNATGYREPSALLSGDYRQINLTLKNAQIIAAHLGGGTDWIGVTTFTNLTATTYGHAYGFPTPATPGTGAPYIASHPSTTVNISGGLISAWPGKSLQTILMYHSTAQANNDPTKPYTVNVTNYQNSGQNFRVYFTEQATENLYGGLSPCADTTTHPEIIGITCGATVPTPTPTPTPTPPPTPDPCVVAPLRVSSVKFPTSKTGGRSLSWNSGIFQIVGISLTYTPSLRVTFTDSRGCAFTVVK